MSQMVRSCSGSWSCCGGAHCSSAENRRFSDFSQENDGVFALRRQLLLRQKLPTTNGRPYTVNQCFCFLSFQSRMFDEHVSNLLDNTIEGCQRLSGSRSIRCCIELTESLYISIRNTAPPVSIRDGLFPATKPPPGARLRHHQCPPYSRRLSGGIRFPVPGWLVPVCGGASAHIAAGSVPLHS